MKILLIRPKPHKNTINLQSFMICEPLELEYLASVLKGYETTIIDMIIEKKPLSYFLKMTKYDIVCITGYLPHVNIMNDYAKIIKTINQETFVIVGGIVAEVNPEIFDREYIDYIVSFNPLESVKKIVASISEKKPLTEEELMKSIVPKAIEIPAVFPDRKATQKYRKKYNYIFHQECATLKTSYGCPYNCDFCYCNILTHEKYKTRPINEVIKEIKLIEENNIFIVDDNFLYNKERLNEFVKLYRENDIKKKFITFGRSDFIIANEELLIDLKSIGLTAVFVGIESFKEEELKEMNKLNDVETNINAIRLLDKLGIECYKGIIVGYDWDKSDFRYLEKLLRSFKHAFVNIQPITPLYGTKFYNKIKNNITTPQNRYHLFDMAHLVCEPTKLSKRNFYYQILRLYLRLSIRRRNIRYIIDKYGRKVYKRVRFGARKIAFQYIKLILKG